MSRSRKKTKPKGHLGFIGNENLAYKIAFRDISEHLQKLPGYYKDRFDGEAWIVTPFFMNTKETRRLNRELNLHTINRNPFRMRRNKTIKHYTNE